MKTKNYGSSEEDFSQATSIALNNRELAKNEDQQAIIDFVGRFVNLEDLQLVGCNSLKPETIKRMVEKLPKLVSLDLSFCRQLSNEDIKEIIISGNLSVLNLRGTAITELVLPTQNNLKEIMLEDCFDLQAITIEEGPTFENLKVVNLSGSRNLGFEEILKIIKSSPRLEEINFTLHNLNNDQIRTILALTNNLKALSLSYCQNITEFEPPKSLEILDIKDSQLQPEQLIKVLESSPNLKTLDITDCQHGEEIIKWIEENQVKLPAIETIRCDGKDISLKRESVVETPKTLTRTKSVEKTEKGIIK
jgi:hypothetical protein